MKTTTALSALFVSAALLTTACTPRDVKVVDDGTRIKILDKKSRGKAGYNSTDFKIGAYSMSAFLMEKQIEALELVRLAVGQGDAAKTQYQISDRSDSAVKITSTQDELQYQNDNGNYNGKMTKTFAATIVKEGDIVKSLSIKANGIKSSSDAVGKKKNFLNLFENSYELALNGVAGNDAVAEIKVTIKGGIQGALGQQIKTSNFDLSLVLNVDKASLSTDDIKINSISATSTYDGSNTDRKFTTTIAGNNLALHAEGLCNKLNGVAAITTDKTKKAVSFESDIIRIGDKWSNKLADCGKRPTVDLSRLLVY